MCVWALICPGNMVYRLPDQTATFTTYDTDVADTPMTWFLFMNPHTHTHPHPHTHTHRYTHTQSFLLHHTPSDKSLLAALCLFVWTTLLLCPLLSHL